LGLFKSITQELSSFWTGIQAKALSPFSSSFETAFEFRVSATVSANRKNHKSLDHPARLYSNHWVSSTTLVD
jgi:hypothetical protein